MRYAYLSLLSCVLINSHSLHTMMDFHQRAVDLSQKGLDLRVVIALGNQNVTLACAGQNKSISEFCNDCARDEHNPLNAAMLYLLEQGKIVNRGPMVDCVDKTQLLALHGKGLYAVYTKRGNTLPVLLLGTSDSKDIELLTKYLILKSSHAKENGYVGPKAPRASVSLPQSVLALQHAKYNENSVI